MASPPVRSAESHPTGPGGRPQPVLARVGSAPRGDRGRSRSPGRADGGAIAPGRAACGGPAPSRRFPPCGHEGTERRIARPQDPLEQPRCDRGKKTGQTVKHVFMKSPRTISCSMIDFEKPMVFRANRLMRVRKVRCLRSIFCVCCFPTSWVSRLRCRSYTPA
jgi:hypothetical protein